MVMELFLFFDTSAAYSIRYYIKPCSWDFGVRY